jgi:hypothetical protein
VGEEIHAQRATHEATGPRVGGEDLLGDRLTHEGVRLEVRPEEQQLAILPLLIHTN